MNIFLKSFLSIFLVSIFLSFFITNTSLAYNYSLDVFANKAGYNSGTAKAPLEVTIQVVINAILSLAGIVFLILAVYAGIRWMTAQGNAEDVTKAQETLQAAVIGMVVIASSYAITNFIMKNLPSTTPIVDNSSENSGTPTVPTPSSKKAAGADCTSSAECESGECKTGKCSAVLPKCVTDADCKVVGEKCVGAVCKSALAGTSDTCKPACIAGQYCDVVGGANATPGCKPGCAKDADCVGIKGTYKDLIGDEQIGDKSYCQPGFHTCAFPPNLGTSCGPSGIGQCQFNSPVGYVLSIDSLPVCSLDFSVKCWIKKDQCISDKDCTGGNGFCNLTKNTCDYSPKGVCEKNTNNFWLESFNSCYSKSSYEGCKQISVTCISDCSAPIDSCIVECKKISSQQKKFECFDECIKKFPADKTNTCKFQTCQNGLVSCINALNPQ